MLCAACCAMCRVSVASQTHFEAAAKPNYRRNATPRWLPREQKALTLKIECAAASLSAKLHAKLPPITTQQQRFGQHNKGDDIEDALEMSSFDSKERRPALALTM